jgi:hypothetical protein
MNTEEKSIEEENKNQPEPKINDSEELKQVTQDIVDNDTLERNKYVFDLVNMWIGNADNKIELAFAILSAIVAVIALVAEDMLSGFDVTNANICLLCYFRLGVFISGVLFLVSVFFYLSCLIPRFTNDNQRNKKYSIFYDEIKDFDCYKEYVEACKSATNEMFNEEIIKETYFNSKICSTKMRSFRKGLIFSGASIISTLLTALLYYIAVV